MTKSIVGIRECPQERGLVEHVRKRRSVVERHGHTIDAGGVIHYDDRPLSWEEADKLAGRRLDRRENWAFIDGRLCDSVTYTINCSGCSYDTDYGSSRVGGCEECGYHGVVRLSEWVPVIVQCCEWESSGRSLASVREGVAEPCPHAPTYDAGLCCGHPDDCTFVSPTNLSNGETDA